VRLYRHTEEHSTTSEAVRDVVIGAADGLTVPFALAAGLAGAVAQSHIVLTAGLAEIAAGAIAMGLGGFLAARSEADHYASELRREEREINELPDHEEKEVIEILEEYGLERGEAERVMTGLRRDPKRWVQFMMRFELGLEAPKPGRALRSALTIGGSYFVGGLVPLTPYLLTSDIEPAFWASAGVTLLSLLSFGGVKGRLTGMPVLRSAFHTAIIGGLAAAVAYGVARFANSL
jgi:VIT1/CCC1 family predicted Fe2+/Mn2+ transporter